MKPSPRPPNATLQKELLLSGVVPFSSVDFPGALAAVLFCQGCPWACRYCHNPHLRPFALPQGNPWRWDRMMAFLHERTGFLDAVVFSGGEATAQSALPAAISEVKAMGFRIGLHTSGAYPQRLAEVLPLIDWVGLDIKAPLDARYDLITGVSNSGAPVRASLLALMASGISYQLRTTVHPLLLSAGDLEDLHLELGELGAQPTVIQNFRKLGCIDAQLIAETA